MLLWILAELGAAAVTVTLFKAYGMDGPIAIEVGPDNEGVGLLTDIINQITQMFVKYKYVVLSIFFKPTYIYKNFAFIIIKNYIHN